VGARCGKSARRVLSGGRPERAVPTGITLHRIGGVRQNTPCRRLGDRHRLGQPFADPRHAKCEPIPEVKRSRFARGSSGIARGACTRRPRARRVHTPRSGSAENLPRRRRSRGSARRYRLHTWGAARCTSAPCAPGRWRGARGRCGRARYRAAAGEHIRPPERGASARARESTRDALRTGRARRLTPSLRESSGSADLAAAICGTPRTRNGRRITAPTVRPRALTVNVVRAGACRAGPR
jgi:hypothetical protein